MIGTHISIDKNIYNTIQKAISIKSNVLQIFLKSPYNVKKENKIKIATNDIIKIRKYVKSNNIKLFVHSSYLLNFSKELSKNGWAIDDYIRDLEMLSKLGGIGSVIHMGKYTTLSKKEAYNNFVSSIEKVIDNTPDDIQIILETSCGCGTEIGFRLEELSKIYYKINNKKRISFCIDTCHIFSAGYPVNTVKGVNDFFALWNKLIGIDKISLIHLNDSKNGVESHVDRHEVIGKGYIYDSKLGGSMNALKRTVLICFKNNIPIVIEKHNNFETSVKEIKMIRKIVEMKGGNSVEEVIKILKETGDIERVLGNTFKYNAYILVTNTLKREPHLLNNLDELVKIKGIGKKMIIKIEEILKTGRLKQLDEYKKNNIYSAVNELTNVLGIGIKFAKELIEKGIYNVKDLRSNKKVKLNKKQLLGLKYYDDLNRKIPRDEVKEIFDLVSKTVGYKFVLTGSYRRGAEFSKDVDIIVTHPTKKMPDFSNIVNHEIIKGTTKYSGLIKVRKYMRIIDVRFVKPDSLVTTVFYYTGSREFNIYIRSVAKQKGYLLNEYGLYKGKKKINVNSEKEIFEILKLKYVKPSSR